MLALYPIWHYIRWHYNRYALYSPRIDFPGRPILYNWSLALVGGGLLGAERGPVEAELLRAAAEGAQVVDDHVQVLGLVEVVHLQERLFDDIM